ncbi:(2Fe-2S)-binding protein [Opitutales bacterium ASA1]|uniref:(2Fe-2S)-binding protein n=1 Tax=Congregicoccus parvus TaxID=3081749 RepID=UPI002B2C0FEF|nr:(2Fe-2S)-binding protein [Opitutales bacterium ASA1]
MTETIPFNLDGTAREVRADPARDLLTVLREDLESTGTKYGCGEAQCGACTVLVDGVATRACVTPVGVVLGRDVRTIEGLEREGRLHPVQQAFLDEDALQCGYCTPGMIMGAVALLERNTSPTRAEIVRAMNPHVCRCCAYPRIVAAIESAARVMKGGAV